MLTFFYSVLFLILIILLCSCWFFFQYVTKNGSELHQRAIPKQTHSMSFVDERDDSLETQVERIPAINHPITDPVSPPDFVAVKSQPEISSPKPAVDEKAASPERTASETEAPSVEPPHIYVETEEVRQARLDRQWKQLKLDVSELPDIYSRLSKIKLTGRIRHGFCCECNINGFPKGLVFHMDKIFQQLVINCHVIEEFHKSA